MERRCASSSSSTPALDKAAVRFQVVSEGERGLLGVGYAPARVIASVDADGDRRALRPTDAESELAAQVRELLERITTALGVRCRIDVAEDDEALVATCSGGDLGLLIGKHGADDRRGPVPRRRDRRRAGPTSARTSSSTRPATATAAGATLEALAVRSAEEALRDGDARRARADDAPSSASSSTCG